MSADYDSALNAYESGFTGRALRLSKAAAEKGSTDAAVMAGHILRHGEAGHVDLPSARRYYEMAASLGHPDALVALGEMGLNGEAGLTDAEAFSYLTRASDAGRIDATRALAEMNRTGRGTKKSIQGQRDMLNRAVASFDAEATKDLADTYFESDPKKALDLYEQAAKSGHAEAAYIAGLMYANNFDIRPNEERSAKYLEQAARFGHAAAQADYGLIVYQGAGVKRDEAEAAEWFRKSAHGGDSEGMFLYAFTLAKGEGIEQNFEESYYWVLRAGESEIDDYQEDRATLRQRLEDHVDPDIIAKARARFNAR